MQKERKMNAARMKNEHSKNKNEHSKNEKMNAARTKNETALCEVRSRESGRMRALIIAQRSRESFFIPMRAADWKERSGSSTTSALGRSLCNFRFNEKEISFSPKNNQSQVQTAIA